MSRHQNRFSPPVDSEAFLPLLCFTFLEAPIVCPWAASKLRDIGLLLRMGKLPGAPSLRGPGASRAHFACPGRTPNETFSDMSGISGFGCVLLAVLSWHEHLSGLLFYGSLQTAWERWKGLLDLRKKVVRKEHEESEALGELRFPSDVSTHGFFCWPSEVCALHSHSLPRHPSFSLPPSLPHWEPSLCIILELSDFYFFVLGNLESPCEPPFWYFKWGNLLSPVFLEFFLEGVRGIEMLLPSLHEPPALLRTLWSCLLLFRRSSC